MVASRRLSAAPLPWPYETHPRERVRLRQPPSPASPPRRRGPCSFTIRGCSWDFALSLRSCSHSAHFLSLPLPPTIAPYSSSSPSSSSPSFSSSSSSHTSSTPCHSHPFRHSPSSSSTLLSLSPADSLIRTPSFLLLRHASRDSCVSFSGDSASTFAQGSPRSATPSLSRHPAAESPLKTILPTNVRPGNCTPLVRNVAVGRGARVRLCRACRDVDVRSFACSRYFQDSTLNWL